MLWGYDSSLVDENNQVVIDNPKTIESLEYVAELYKTFIPGTLSWLAVRALAGTGALSRFAAGRDSGQLV